jgi:hypothetical protein
MQMLGLLHYGKEPHIMTLWSRLRNKLKAKTFFLNDVE